MNYEIVINKNKMKKKKRNKQLLVRKNAVVALMGGLGDQINQFIYGLYISRNFNTNIIYDITYYHDRPAFSFKLKEYKTSDFIFKRNFFKLKYRYISYLRFIKKFKILINFISNGKIKNYYYEDWLNNQNQKIKKLKNKSYFFGYWHNKSFYEKELKNIRKILSLKKKSRKLNKIISGIEENDIAIHIRGKDYLQNSHAIVLNKNYYEKAIKFFDKKFIKKRFFIFTDDLEHSKKIISKISNLKFIYLDKYKLKDFEEFEILKNFNYYIISNSTFAWTASMLSQKKKLIAAPSQWYKNSNNGSKKIVKEMKLFSNK